MLDMLIILSRCMQNLKDQDYPKIEHLFLVNQEEEEEEMIMTMLKMMKIMMMIMMMMMMITKTMV